MLFEDKRQLSLTVPAKDQTGKPSTVGFLINHLVDNVMKDTRQELFILDNHL